MRAPSGDSEQRILGRRLARRLGPAHAHARLMPSSGDR